MRTSYAPMSYVWNYTAYEKTFRYPAESRTGEGSAQWQDPYGSVATIYRMVGRASRCSLASPPLLSIVRLVGARATAPFGRNARRSRHPCVLETFLRSGGR